MTVGDESGGPSGWAHRGPLLALGCAGFFIATYLAVHQAQGTLGAVWEPLFGRGSARILGSSVARLLPVPDAAVGALGYAAEVVAGSLGGTDRWRTSPRSVLVFVAIALAMGIGSVGLLVAQPIVFHAFCTLCLLSAAISIALALGALDEGRAALRTVRAGGHRRATEVGTDGGTDGGTTDKATDATAATGASRAMKARARERMSDRTSHWKERSMTNGQERRDGGSERPEVVVITGASAGVGRATAHEFARHGAWIGLLARGQAGLEGAKREVESLGGRAIAIPTDVSDPDAVERAAARVEAELGPIDIWINDAMASVFSPVKEMTPEDYRRVTDVTYLGFVYGTLAALKRMLPRDRGTIVEVGSALAYRGIPLQSAYCAAKHAVQGFTDSLHAELIHDESNVKLTMVQLPAVNTPQFDWVRSRLPHRAQPVPPIFQPEVPAKAIWWTAHHPRRELSVGYPTLLAIYVNKIAPGWLDHYLAWTGYSGQQTDEPEDPNRPDNLQGPLDDTVDHGTHGRFDDRSRDFAPALWANTHRPAIALTVGTVVAAAVAMTRMSWRR